MLFIYLLFVISIEKNTMILKGDEVLPSRLKDRPRSAKATGGFKCALPAKL